MLTQNDLQEIGKLMDEKMDAKLKKALSGVVRKKDLRAMENRFMKKVNTVLDHCDGRLLAHDKRIIRIEAHLHLSSSA